MLACESQCSGIQVRLPDNLLQMQLKMLRPNAIVCNAKSLSPCRPSAHRASQSNLTGSDQKIHPSQEVLSNCFYIQLNMNIDSAAAVKQQMNPNMIDPSKPEVGNAIGGGIQLPSTETSQLHSKRFGHPYHANPASLPDMESISPSPTTATACPTEPDPAKINAIWDNLNAAGCHPLPTRDQIRCLWSAPVDAPLTYETLLNLATPSIKTDRSLRHEMNYITDIKFFRKENRENPLTRQRLADEFWQALAIELCILQARSLQQRKRCLLQDTQPTFLGSIWPRFPQRLVKMSHELRDITPMVTQRPHQESLSTKDLDPIVYKTTRAISNVPSLLNVIEQLTQRSYQIGRREHDVDNANIRSRSFDIDADCFDAFKMARELRILFEGIERIKMVGQVSSVICLHEN